MKKIFFLIACTLQFSLTCFSQDFLHSYADPEIIKLTNYIKVLEKRTAAYKASHPDDIFDTNSAEKKAVLKKLFKDSLNSYSDSQIIILAEYIKHLEKLDSLNTIAMAMAMETKTIVDGSHPKTQLIVQAEKKDIKKIEKEKTLLVDTLISHNINSKFQLKPNVGIENLSAINITNREAEIQKARAQLDYDKMNASTLQDSLIINEREALLNAAILELSLAKKMIELQKKDISVQRKLLLFSICCILLLIGFLFLIYKHYREKRRTNILLNEKNKKITDSINYASRIQKSILLPENEIKKLLPQSFIYYQPRDIVSGDFYWFAEVEEGQVIIATVDCTGHGIPGAFMSLVGNILLNEIINEKHITQPSSILKLLHAGVLKALHQQEKDSLSQDGMEMSLCVINLKKNCIEFAGAMNPIYVVKDNMISIINADTYSIGGKSLGARKNTEVEFTNQVIPIQKDMSVYMFTDGYADQFGGLKNKKFNIPQFKNLLLDIQSMEMGMQKQAIEQAMKEWKGNHKQTDDMLVIGLRF